MDATEWLLIWLAAGVFLQAAWLLKQSRTSRGIQAKVILLISLFTAGYWAAVRLSIGVPFLDALPYYVLMWCFLFAVLFRDEVLPQITEETVLIFNVLFAYLAFKHFSPLLLANPVLLAGFLLPTLAAVGNAFVNKPLGFKARLFFYAWFLAITIFLIGFQSLVNPTLWLALGNLTLVENGFPLPLEFQGCIGGQGPLICDRFFGPEILLLGATLLYLMIYATTLFLLVPWPQKHLPYRDTLRHWRKHLERMAGKFSIEQMEPAKAGLLLAGLLGVLLANNVLKAVDDATAISTLLLATQWLGRSPR